MNGGFARLEELPSPRFDLGHEQPPDGRNIPLDGPNVRFGGEDVPIDLFDLREQLLALRAVPRLRAFMREHDLAGAVAATAFLEGRDPAEEVPRDFLFRWFIPHWKVWLVAIVAVTLVAAALYVGELP